MLFRMLAFIHRQWRLLIMHIIAIDLLQLGFLLAFGGVGATPFMFMLPFSKLIFQMIMTLSITNAQKREDLFLPVKVPVKLNIKDYYYAVTFWKGQRLSKHFLRKEDPYFKAIINAN